MNQDYDDIDWNEMWRRAKAKKSWRQRAREDWDGRAPHFHARQQRSRFAPQILAIVCPHPEWTVLDIGAGPGTLALPLARMTRRVTAVDFSAGMVEVLTQAAARERISNIRAVQAAWEDDWQQLAIEMHDLTIASRSLAVTNLAAALTKLNDHASRRVCIIERVGAGSFEPELFAAAGRPFVPGPDYIYIVNLLYRMSIHARVDFITAPRTFASPAEAMSHCRWVLAPLTVAEEMALSSYIDSWPRDANGRLLLPGSEELEWAVLWWDK